MNKKDTGNWFSKFLAKIWDNCHDTAPLITESLMNTEPCLSGTLTDFKHKKLDIQIGQTSAALFDFIV